MKITIRKKDGEEHKLEGTPKEVVKWIRENLPEGERDEILEGLKNGNFKDSDVEVSDEEIEEMMREFVIGNVGELIKHFGQKRPEDIYKTVDGKTEIPLNLDSGTEKKLKRLVEKVNKTEDELFEEAINKEHERVGNIDTVNLGGLYELFNIPENDRFKNFQLTKQILTNGYEAVLEDMEQGNDKQKQHAKREYPTYKYFINPVLKELKLFELDKEVIPMLTLQDFDEQKSPFNAIGVDCNVWINKGKEKNLYMGFLIGSYFTEDNIHYRCVITIYARKDEKGQLHPEKDLFILEKDLCKKLTGKTYEGQYGKIRKFIYAFLNYINSPEVTIKDLPYNPKNNKRREEKGRVPIPPSSRIYIHGSQLRKYVDKINEGVRTFGYSHRFWVRGHYEHFWNEKRYNKVYSLSDEELKNKGYDKTPKGVIRKWRNAFLKGQGLVMQKDYKVTK